MTTSVLESVLESKVEGTCCFEKCDFGEGFGLEDRGGGIGGGGGLGITSTTGTDFDVS